MNPAPSEIENLVKFRELCETNGLRVFLLGGFYNQIFILPSYVGKTPSTTCYLNLSLELDVDVLVNPDWEEIESKILEHSVKTTFTQ